MYVCISTERVEKVFMLVLCHRMGMRLEEQAGRSLLCSAFLCCEREDLKMRMERADGDFIHFHFPSLASFSLYVRYRK
jgi:hypothetical protein